MKLSVFCSLPGCRRFTRHSSGRCHDHRGAAPISSPAPTLPDPALAPPMASARYEMTDTPSDIGDRWSGYRANTSRTGDVTEEWFDEEGRRHRPGGAPAVLTTGEDGTVVFESFYENGVEHRADGGPTGTRWQADGTLYASVWRQEGMLHRVGGPSEIYYLADGSVEEENFHLRGKRYEELADYARDLASYPSDEIERGLATTRYAPLIEQGHDPHRIVAAIAEGVQTLEGIELVIDGTPPEWVRSFEEGSR